MSEQSESATDREVRDTCPICETVGFQLVRRPDDAYQVECRDCGNKELTTHDAIVDCELGLHDEVGADTDPDGDLLTDGGQPEAAVPHSADDTERCCENPKPLELGDKVPEIYGYSHRCLSCGQALQPESSDELRTDGGKVDGGLYQKYHVETADGEPALNCFVLEPETDGDAREAIRAYADATDNGELANDLRDWMAEIEERDHDVE